MLVSILLAALAADPPAQGPVGDLERGHRAFRAGEYREAARVLAGLAAKLPRNRDYALYLAAESEFYAGAPGRARTVYDALARERGSRFAAIAPWRAADCLWAEGRRRDAVAAYRRLLKAGRPPGDPVPARFRVATSIAEAGARGEPGAVDEARRLFRQIHVEAPAHPLAAEAGRRAGPPATVTTAAVPPRERLRRAVVLAEGKHYVEALEELERLPPGLPADLQLERDFGKGMAKYRMRRDYAGAAKLLLGVAGQATGERAAFAAFHGARALSRVDRDDEAIAGYHEVVRRHAGSRWAAEAQFLAGWLDFNRGKYREALPGLQATLTRFGRSPFANDAAWFLAMARYLSREPAQALTALDEYLRLSGSDAEAARRALYWRARALDQLGRVEEGRALLRESVRRGPLGWYGLVARARLKAAGHAVDLPLPEGDLALPPAGHDLAVVRSEELLRAGLVAEAGYELERAEQRVIERLGKDVALRTLLERYPRGLSFRRARQLAETRGAAALAAAPLGTSRLIWEAAWPLAYRELVERHGPPAGNPALFLYAIMHKESAFAPYLVSYADARGLLQVIPAVGKDVADRLGVPFFPDELYDPEVNVRLGALHIGGLFRRFKGQPYLVAGAYNGGVKAMTRWCEQHGTRPTDEFVELIAYEQTREYVKRVMGIHARYQYLYGGSVYELPLRVDAQVVRDADGPRDVTLTPDEP